MGLPDLTRSGLQKASKKNELIIETAHQIQKDFGEFGFEITFSGDIKNFYTELFVQMQSNVVSLLGENSSRFMHFLYRIDISEKQIKQYENEMPEANYDEVITELIIHRELKKVITRDYFRQHGTSGI